MNQQYYDNDDDMNGDSISSNDDDEVAYQSYSGVHNHDNNNNNNPNFVRHGGSGGDGVGDGVGGIISMMDDLAYGSGSIGGGGAGGLLDESNYMMNSSYLGGSGILSSDGIGGTGGGFGEGMGGGEGGGLLHHEFNNHNAHLGAGGVVVDFDDPRIASLPRILLMGPRRAGKTSIQRVVFHKMSPHETLFRLEATQLLERAVVDHTPLCRFTIWDFPGELYEGGYELGGGGGDVGVGGEGDDGYPDDEGRGGEGEAGKSSISSPMRKSNHRGVGNSTDDQIFAKATALIFVLDAQDEPYDHVLQSFTDTVTRAVRSNPSIAIEVFVHKVDGELFLSDEAKYDCRRDVMQQVADELADAGLSHDAIPISYHLTSIYDHSVFEAFSRVVQRLIPELPTLENLLNVLVSTCSMEKAYLFDVASKLYISTDSSPVDMQSVELCSDMIDVVLDVSGIYGMGGGGGGPGTTAKGDKKQGSKRVETLSSSFEDGNENIDGDDIIVGGGGAESRFLNESEFGIVDADESNMLEILATNNESSVAEDGEGDNVNGINDDDDNDNDVDDELLGKVVGKGPPSLTEEDEDEDAAADAASSAYDSESSSTIHLSNGMVLYLKEVDTMLALVCLTRAENFRKKSLINYNIGCLKRALMALPQSTAAAAAGGSGVGM
jgi:Ras-related GTP-binding protein C/D